MATIKNENQKEIQLERKSDFSKKSLHRSINNKVFAGVAGGIGEYFNTDPTIIRLLFILTTFFGGLGIIIYIICWIIMPSPRHFGSASDDIIQQNFNDISNRTKSKAHNLTVNTSDSTNDSRFWLGFLIIIWGIVLLFQNLGIFNLFNFQKFWPTFLIVLGIILVLKKK